MDGVGGGEVCASWGGGGEGRAGWGMVQCGTGEIDVCYDILVDAIVLVQ